MATESVTSKRAIFMQGNGKMIALRALAHICSTLVIFIGGKLKMAPSMGGENTNSVMGITTRASGSGTRGTAMEYTSSLANSKNMRGLGPVVLRKDRESTDGRMGTSTRAGSQRE